MMRSIGSVIADSPAATLRSSDNAIVRQLMIRLLTGKGTHVSSNCRSGLVPDGYHRVNYERNPAVCREEAIVAPPPRGRRELCHAMTGSGSTIGGASCRERVCKYV